MLEDTHVQKIARGERTAFRMLHEELYGRLFYYVFKLSRDREASEDLVQEAFIRFWEHRATFDSLLAVKVYLFTYLKNKIMTRARDEGNRRRILAGMTREEAFTEDHLMVAAEVCGEVHQAVSELPERTRRVIELSMEEMSVEEVAAALAISPNSVKTLKKAGYQALRVKLKHLKALLPLLFLP
ncbi:MAG: sigma-70 family RNA polymerase sigma factor [Odoribacteraceae bacterium]|jgi:RNA polymerase sigma-70 factor (ECF subfamily)|nr:sigma-70 family RNA polymerase sigma factor [Odoribacteraceae bacterium]